MSPYPPAAPSFSIGPPIVLHRPETAHASTSTPSTPPVTASTGFDTGLWLFLGVVLVVAGVALYVWAGRKRTRS